MSKITTREKVESQVRTLTYRIEGIKKAIEIRIEGMKRDCDNVLRKMKDESRTLSTIGEFQNAREIDRMIAEYEMLREQKKNLEYALEEEKE